ncbi:MAG: N-acetylgalactosamine-6-sulfatase [Porphyromonadaceae bacterium CG2_30_38_12]|nr:MAG: N-acetylgalactosamine-6-sulfatase [Porphyromonadaceae bacterium CG2_30_38_12]
MRSKLKYILGASLVSWGGSVLLAAGSSDKPNIIYILADDLGYGELGCYGQRKIETPNIDKLAEKGMIFTQHYSGSAVSAPSRSVLLTGKHTGHTYIRGNDELSSRGNVWNHQAVFDNPTLEGQRPFPANTKLLPQLFKEAGYQTACIGKWGLGYPESDSTPTKMGFDFFYGYNCQRQAHTYFPAFLYKNEERVLLNNSILQPGTPLSQGANPYDAKSYVNFNQSDYSPDLMFKEILSFVDKNKQNPFFLMWNTPLPHVSLQAPEKWVNYYVKKFGDEKPFFEKSLYFPSRYPRATYAAMISYLDEWVGNLIDFLKKSGLYENTVVVFTSDNGPSFQGGADPVFFDSAGPFKSERGWGKTSLHEGGIRVPMIVSWPGKIKEKSFSDHISAFWDVMPTFAEIVRVKSPATDGISFLPTLLGKKQPKHKFLYWEYPEYNGTIAVRKDNWKGIIQNVNKGNKELELFDLNSDPQEMFNVASNHPSIVKKMNEYIQESHTVSGVERFRFPFETKKQ